MGKNQTMNKSGKIIFEQNRLILAGGGSKETFDIIKISQADNILSFDTQNNKQEKASFYLVYTVNKIEKVNLNMQGMDGTLVIGIHSVTIDNLMAIYKNQISTCNCNTINRADGAIITSCDPLPVASDNKMEIGLSLMSNGTTIYGAISIRFTDNNIMPLVNNINIVLEDGQHISASYINQQKTVIGNSAVQLGVFELTSANVSKIKISNVSVINFTLSDNFARSFEARTNKDVLITHYNCIMQK
jgi:hypothetical protein